MDARYAVRYVDHVIRNAPTIYQRGRHRSAGITDVFSPKYVRLENAACFGSASEQMTNPVNRFRPM
jgi:hypothetical protein